MCIFDIRNIFAGSFGTECQSYYSSYKGLTYYLDSGSFFYLLVRYYFGTGSFSCVVILHLRWQFVQIVIVLCFVFATSTLQYFWCIVDIYKGTRIYVISNFTTRYYNHYFFFKTTSKPIRNTPTKSTNQCNTYIKVNEQNIFFEYF